MATKSDELRRLARRELARRASMQNLGAFTLFTCKGYEMGWFHRTVCEELDRFFDEVEAKKSPRLILCAPPRHGKSELVSRRFPAYALGRDPNLQIIATSYSSDLSTAMNRDVQRIIDDEAYREVFPETTLSGANAKPSGKGAYLRTSDKFEVVGHSGAYRSAGVGGGITGMGADIAIIDDPFKDRQEANSPTIRARVWDWYTSTLYTRLSTGGGVIVMCTRWHEDDLIGRLLNAEAEGGNEGWRVVNFPAVAEYDEPYRKEGEALHPERYPIKRLEQIRQTVGARDWASLYQQHPIPDGGNLFSEEWLRFWTPDTLPSRFDSMVSSWDMTFKNTNHSDFVVGQVWGRKGSNFYLLDQVRARMDFVQTAEAFGKLSAKWQNVTRRLVEDKANGTAIISALRDRVSGIVPVTPTESKEARAYAVSSLFEAGNVFLPSPEVAPWVKNEYIPELLSFPSGKHDDQVDATTQALNDMKSHSAWSIHPSNLVALRGF